MFEHWAEVKVRKGETNNSHQTRVKQLLASHGMPNKYQLQRQEGFGGQICKCEICKKRNLSFLNSPWVPSVPWVLICQKDPSKKKHVKLTEHTHLRYKVRDIWVGEEPSVTVYMLLPSDQTSTCTWTWHSLFFGRFLSYLLFYTTRSERISGFRGETFHRATNSPEFPSRHWSRGILGIPENPGRQIITFRPVSPWTTPFPLFASLTLGPCLPG